MSRRERVALFACWAMWMVSGYLAVSYKMALDRVNSMDHFPNLAGRVAELEDSYNAMKDSRDYWRALAKGKVVTE